MTEDVWYYHHAGTQYGPVSFSQLQSVAADGQLEADDLVWQYGTSGWVAARTVPELLPAPSVSPDGEQAQESPWSPADTTAEPGPGDAMEGRLPHLRLIDRTIRSARGPGLTRALNAIDRAGLSAGRYGYVVAAVLASVLLTVIAIRTGSIGLGLAAVAVLPVAALLQYVGMSSLRAGRGLRDTAPPASAPAEVLGALSAATCAGALVALGFGLLGALSGGSAAAAVSGLAWFVVLGYATVAWLDPDMTDRAAPSDANTGGDAIGVVAVVARLVLLRLIPFAFWTASCVGALALLVLCLGALGDHLVSVVVLGPSIAAAVVALPLLPLAGHLGYLLVALAVELVVAVLDNPTRLDALAGALALRSPGPDEGDPGEPADVDADDP